MRARIRDALFWLCERSLIVPWIVNLALYNLKSIISLRGRFADATLSYPSVSGRIGTMADATFMNDTALNFFARCANASDYAFIIELGAYTGDRSIALAKIFPDVPVYALDVTEDFASPSTRNGVSFGPNNLSYIETIMDGHPGKGLIVSNGTLAYYSQDDLADLFALAARRKADLAFSEPNVSFGETTRTRSFPRTRLSRYHPYIAMLRASGFEMPDQGGMQMRDTFGTYAEERAHIFARS